MELDNAMSESGDLFADAEQGDAADPPVGEERELFDGDGPQGEGAPEAEDDAEPAEPQPGKKPQSREENARFAAARKEAEARLRAERAEWSQAQAKVDAFARQYGYGSFKELERAEAARRMAGAGMGEAAAREFAEIRGELAAARAESERAQEETARQQGFNELFEEYPELGRAGRMPDEVWDAVEAGETPLHAYRAYENRQLKERLRVMEQNERNSRKAVGSAHGASNGDAQPDAFLAGLGGL